MRKKILLYYIILIITGLTITGFFVTKLAQTLYKDEVRQRLLTVASLFDDDLAQALQSGDPVDYNALAEAYEASLDNAFHENEKGIVTKARSSSVAEKAAPANTDESTVASRITIIDYQGNVIGESQTDSNLMENHLNRKEVQQAILGKIGEDTRFSTTIQMDFLYIAVPSSWTDAIIRVSVPLIQLDRINAQIWLYCLLGILAGLMLTILLAYRFASAISRPVHDLTVTSKKIADGNYSKRASIMSKDELGQLAETFNEMADKLNETVTILTNRNIQFDAILNSMTNSFVAVDSDMRIILTNAIAARFFGLSDENIAGKKLIEVIRNNQLNQIMQKTISSNQSSVSEISLITPEEGIFRVYASPIKTAADTDTNSGGILTIHDVTNLKKLEQIRTDFVSNVTHELKTPLTSIKGFVETLRSGAVKDMDVADQFLEIIDIETERLTMLINDILQLSEIENNHIDTNLGKHNLAGIITEVVSILQGSADKKHVTLTVKAASDITLTANRNRIKQMLINLIENAIKYNVENGSVCIKAVKAEGRLVITVADTGIGIEQEHLSRIFERFYRVDKGRSRSMGGTGLGLSIVKHIVNLYDGDVRVESEPGKGTRFIVQLPG